MNLPNDILNFIERWHGKASHYETERLSDIFDHFFSAFVLYNFLYNLITELEKYPYKNDDEQAAKTIKKFLGAEVIFNDAVISENAVKIKELVSNGTFYIRETAWDRERIEKLSSAEASNWSKGLLEIIYQIRCNTFHGSKSFTDDQKSILIPCIKIVERINGMVIDKIKT